jgi:uncharacterized protein (TIGR00369 family)
MTDDELRSPAADRIQEIRQLLDLGVEQGIGIGVSLGITAESLSLGRAVFVLDPSPATINGMFTVQGGVLATLMDAAMGSAVHTTLEDGLHYTTLELKANFVRPVPIDGDRLTCVATTIHVGKRTATAQAQVTGEGGKLVAHGTCTCLIYPTDS